MNPLRISLRSLVYYRRTNAAILLACAAASAVMIGSILVGSSVRKTLTERAAERFGHADYVIAAHAHFFREALADDIKGVHDGSGLYAPAVYLKGSAEDPDGSIAVPDVNVVGITRDFPRMYHSREFGNLSGRGAVINRSLADDFGVKQGSSLIITVPRYSAVSRDSLFGRKDRENILTLMRCTVSAVVPDTGPGLFSLSHDELQPRTIFLSLDWLQQRIGKPEQVNCILADTQRDHAALKRVLNRTAEPEDLGFRLKLNRKHGYISLETAGFTFTGDAAEAAHEAGRAAGFAVSDTSVYLFNRIGKGNRTVPYSTVAALEPHQLSAFPALPVIKGGSEFRARQDIILNEWAADDLEADIGDTLTAEYYTPAGGKSKLETGTGTFTVIGIAALQGPAGDPQLVPDFEGITDADSINEWKAPFDIDMSMIRGKDEDYWNRYRATPKAFISSDAARSLWRGSGDDAWITSVRYMLPEHADPEQASAALRKEFRAHFGPDRGGIYTFDVKERAQQAGRGSADYGMLFMSMSMFIIVSVLGLIWQTFRLLCERRMKQNGILLATGCSQRTVAGILLAEGAVTAAAGTCMGIPLAIVYTDMMLNGIKSWGVGSLIPVPFEVSADPAVMITGACAAMAAALVSMGCAAYSSFSVPVHCVIAGYRPFSPVPPENRRKSRITAFILAGSALAAAAAGISGLVSYIAVFFVCGALLLAFGVLFFYRVITGYPGFSHAGFTVRFLSANRSRSLLAVFLVACASFVIVAVAANRKEFASVDTGSMESGTGGFALRADMQVGLFHDLNSADGRRESGIKEPLAEEWNDMHIIALRMNRGEDVSCLNLHQPVIPRVLGVPEKMISRGGFSFADMSRKDHEHPWELLGQDLPGDSIPAFGDANSLQWILHKGIGDEIDMTDVHGNDVKLRIEGSIANSIFGSELLISEEYFNKHFGINGGYRSLLISVPAEHIDSAARMLRTSLKDYGVRVRTASEILGSFAEVNNAYIATFLMLGGLGLLLGTLGLGAVCARNAFERKGEYALMLAVGFKKRMLVAMTFFENGILVSAGIVTGTVSAVIAVIPYMVLSHVRTAIGVIAAGLLVILGIGLVTSAAAAVLTMTGDFIPALRRE